MNNMIINIPYNSNNQIILLNGEMLRIELGKSFNVQFNKVIDDFIRINELNEFKIIKTRIIPAELNQYFQRNESVQNLLKKCKISLVTINDFLLLAEENHLKRIYNTKTNLNELSEQEYRLLLVFILVNSHNRKILIDTKGMYLSVLVSAYKLLKSFLENNGTVIEFAYPHYDANDEIQRIVGEEVRSMKIGCM